MPENDRASSTWEDMGKKAKWFYEVHGKISDKELNRKLHQALDHLKILRASRNIDLDTGGEVMDQDLQLIGASHDDTVGEVTNPYPSASQGFVTKCIEVKTVITQKAPLQVRLRPLEGAKSTMDLRTATVCVFDSRTRQWNLVDHSGYNEKHGYIWGQVHRSGVYAAIALPKDSAKTRVIALEQFVYYYTRFGVESGLIANADEYFNKNTFLRLAINDGNFSLDSKLDKQRLSELSKIFHETLKLHRNWRGPLPNGGLLDWHLIEYLTDRKFTLLKALGLSYFVTRFPWIFRTTYRVGRWYPLGPINVSGRIKSLAIHPANGSILYAGSANGGVWKTTNGGNTWKYLWKFEDSMAVGSLSISSTEPDTVYAATGEDTTWGPSYGGAGVYKTTNAGGTWTQKASASILGSKCSKIIVHPTKAKVVYLASESGIHKTINGGDKWDLMLGGHATDMVIDVNSPKTLYAGVYNDGVYKSTDEGKNWTKITNMVTFKTPYAALAFPFPTGTNAGWVKLAIGNKGPSGSKFIIAKMGEKGGDTYASVDGGGSWTIMLGSEPWDYVTWGSFVAIHPKDARRIYLGGLNMQYTDDAVHFKRCTISHTDHHQIVFDPSNDAICFSCGDGGVFRSTDYGATWQVKSSKLTATQLMSLGVSEKGTFVAGSATQDQGIIQTSGSETWDDFGGGNEWGMFVIDPNDSNNIYISPGSGRIKCSRDRGHSYTNPTSGLTHYWASQKKQTKPAAFYHVAVRPSVSNFIIGAAVVQDEVKDSDGKVVDSYGPVNRLFYSRNWGNDWFNAYTPASTPFRVAYSPSNNNRAYAATMNGNFYRSNNGGERGWYEPASTKNRPPAGKITCITVDRWDPDVVYITYGDVNPHVYRSNDGGQHWTNISGTLVEMSLPDIAASALVVDPENADILFVATDIGVFRSNDRGWSWYYYNDSYGNNDLPKLAVTGLGINSSTKRLFASTMGRGLYYTYTSGFLSLRVIAISHYFFPRRYSRGIARLRVTNGSETYIMSRSEVINRIKAGTNFYTIGRDRTRAEVVLMPPDEDHPIEYLMTTPDSTTDNNLLSLPQF